MKIEIEINYDGNIPDVNQRYCASICGGIYKGIVETGASVSECLQQISVSMYVMDKFNSLTKPINIK